MQPLLTPLWRYRRNMVVKRRGEKAASARGVVRGSQPLLRMNIFFCHVYFLRHLRSGPRTLHIRGAQQGRYVGLRRVIDRSHRKQETARIPSRAHKVTLIASSSMYSYPSVDCFSNLDYLGRLASTQFAQVSDYLAFRYIVRVFLVS